MTLLRFKTLFVGVFTSLALLTLPASPASALGGDVLCPEAEPQVFLAGARDDFAEPPDPAEQRSASMEAAFPDAIWKDFDDPTINRFIGHSFRNLPSSIVRAELVIRARPEGGLSLNDGVALLDNEGESLFSSRFENLPEAEGSWTDNPPTTFTLILQDLQDGTVLEHFATERRLDIFVQDDTTVDFFTLRVWACPTTTRSAGRRDDFAFPPEPARPRADLRNRFPDARWQSFDDDQINRFVGHTFVGLPEGIVQAELEIRMAPLGGLSNNDTLNLLLATDGSFAFSESITNLPESNSAWIGNGATIFTLDLEDLGLVELMTAERRLEVLVQDDTRVDDIRLRLKTCPPPRRFGGVDYGNFIGDFDFTDETLQATEFERLQIDSLGGFGICQAMDDVCPVGDERGPALHLVSKGTIGNAGGSEASLDFDAVNGKVGVSTQFPSGPPLVVSICLEDPQGGQGTEAATVFLPNPPTNPVALLPPETCVKEVDSLDIGCAHGFSLLLSEPVDITLADGTTARGDRLKVQPDCIVGMPRFEIQSFEIRGDNLPQLAFRPPAVQFSGLLATARGGTTFGFGDDTLSLLDLGNSGEDGVSLALEQADSAFVELAPLEITDPLPSGATLQVEAFGTVAEQQDRSLGSLAVRKLPEGPFALDPDFSTIDSPTHTVQILRDHTLIAEFENHEGIAAVASHSPDGLGKLGGELECYVGSFPPDTLFTVDDAVFQGDEIRILAERNGQPIETKTELRLQTQGFSELTLTGAASGKPGNCQETATRLCLEDGRFAVDVDWSTSLGTVGPGGAVHLTDDSGYFWFFDPDNLELVVKVLNAQAMNGRFWVFMAGLTNLEVRVTVTDTRTGVSRQYFNPQGVPFRPIQDVNAFVPLRLVAEGEDGGERDARALETRISSTARNLGDILERGRQMSAGTTTGNTGPLLLSDRFTVDVRFRTQEGDTGFGVGESITADSGFHWFFDPANLETVIKVVDGCALNDRFWVFVAGLTNVEVDITVTDTETNTQAFYSNALGTPFDPILDTSAFATCP